MCHLQSQLSRRFLGQGVFSTFVVRNLICKVRLAKSNLLQALKIRQTDTVDSAISWIPDIVFLVCGDAVETGRMGADTHEKRHGRVTSIKKFEDCKFKRL